MKIIMIGILAAFFFSTTFVLNRAMSLDGGHWVWSASLRYFWMLGFLSVGLFALRRKLFIESLKLYIRHWVFWTVAGGIGFGLFYALISFSASYAPGWVVAATWQTTILATPIVLLLFGKKIPLRAMFLTLIIFAGVLLVNLERAGVNPLNEILLGAIPVFIAAFAYPFGNQLVWEARQGGVRFIPHLDSPAMDDPFCRVLLLTLGSLPLWGVLIAVFSPPAPAMNQIVNTALVAVFSGVAATSLFLYIRHKARSAAELAAADCTQSMEVVFSLLGEVLLLGGALPGALGWAGIALTMLGLALYIRVQNVR
ncbi:Putative multidrug resistance efflux transporter [Maridesulfovibrio ferrireducens]|uniref:Putative multidrug resistance efflux transporter n=1 Tax=Maridesulfovibrio ferrireducens TaxID=246191 RepID=A0A1G9FRK2_9BACT|nr:multidrug resistance efflux transporter family protein [Maridesulfovibrio ferrireducens]SDK91056.1 Putative multidrug resistance efflux transporter [Maridesulfovibrio ferrireducens]